MELLDKILSLSKKHAEVVIVVLLGIIAAGSIAGSLRIAGLKEVLAEKNALTAEREDITRQRLALADTAGGRSETTGNRTRVPERFAVPRRL